MNKNKIIIALIIIIVILSILFVIRVKNNEKEVYSNRTNNTIQKLENTVSENTLSLEKIKSNTESITSTSSNSYVTAIGIITSIVLLLSWTKIYLSLGINKMLVFIDFILMILSNVFEKNTILYTIVFIPTFFITILMIIEFFKAINISLWWLLLFLVPVFGWVVLYIMAMWKLGEAFSAGSVFKLGLVFIPVICIPALAITSSFNVEV